MSRFQTTKKNNKDTTVFYGLDHILGWWYEEWRNDDSDWPSVELDSFSGTLNRAKFIELLQNTNAPVNHLETIVLDIDFN